MTEQNNRERLSDHSTPTGLIFHSGLAYLDDSSVSLRALRRAMGTRSISLETYDTAQALLNRPTDVPLRAVLLDVDLGGSVDGVAVAKALRGQYPEVAIAFFTGADVDQRAIALRDLGSVFNKQLGLDEAVQWFVSVAASRV